MTMICRHPPQGRGGSGAEPHHRHDKGPAAGRKGDRIHASLNSKEALISPHDSAGLPRQRLPWERAYQQPSSMALALAVPACGTDFSSPVGQDARWNLNDGRIQGVAQPQTVPETCRQNT